MPRAIEYPERARIQPGYWLRWGNLWAARRKLRRDGSNDWRYAFHNGRPPEPPDRVVPFRELLGKGAEDGFRFLIIGDTGEGDRSQYGLLPLIRALKPDFMIINGDVAYPAGRDEDYLKGFFQPYQDLGFPIWAVPGNHEYYSTHRGQEFFEIFCTEVRAADWARHGLPLRPQPGTYWEVSETEAGIPLAVIGVDTGHSANLDGKGAKQHADSVQHQWLDDRLSRADRLVLPGSGQPGIPVIVLFHIPSLSNQQHHKKKTHLRTLHRIIASHPSVRLVMCGHEHNHQYYSPARFGEYLEREYGVRPSGHDLPHYIVSGGGGAFLHGTMFGKHTYPAQEIFPTADQWSEYAGFLSKAAHRTGLAKGFIGRIAGWVNKAAQVDADAAKYLSLILVEVTKNSVKVIPACMDNLQDLFPGDGPPVRVDDPSQTVDADALKKTLERCSSLELR
jgi:hypothetical protein